MIEKFPLKFLKFLVCVCPFTLLTLLQCLSTFLLDKCPVVSQRKTGLFYRNVRVPALNKRKTKGC